MMVSNRFLLFGIAAMATYVAPAASLGVQGMLTEPTLVSVPWDPPPSSVDSEYVKTAKALLGNGLGDPRGCPFSRVKFINPRYLYDRSPSSEVLGWVLPDGHHAILMDGVEHPIQAVLGPADLDASIKKMFADKSAIPWMYTAAWRTSATPALLLLVGRPDLADYFVDTTPFRHAEAPFRLCQDLYVELQFPFATSLMTRKDSEGVAWASQMLKVAIIRDREGLVSPYPGSSQSMPPIETTRDLFTEISRRALHPKHEPVDLSGIQKLEVNKRLTFLMDNLDTVEGRQYMTESDSDYSMDPLYKAVLAEGQRAVPELIDALEFDRRYTRTVSFRLGPSTHDLWKFHPVSDVVRALLHELWPTSDHYIDKDNLTMASALRKAWSPVSGLTEAERRILDLHDDSAGARSWFEACQFLASPAGKMRHAIWDEPTPDPVAPLNGEPLRVTHGEEISALITKQVPRAN